MVRTVAPPLPSIALAPPGSPGPRPWVGLSNLKLQRFCLGTPTVSSRSKTFVVEELQVQSQTIGSLRPAPPFSGAGAGASLEDGPFSMERRHAPLGSCRGMYAQQTRRVGRRSPRTRD